MIIFLASFAAAVAVISSVVAFVVASAHAIYSMCALLIFGFVAIALGTHNNRAWSWMFLAVLVMVGVETLAPYSNAVSNILAALVAVIATVSIKRPMLAYIRRDRVRPVNLGGPRLAPWMRIVLTIL